MAQQRSTTNQATTSRNPHPQSEPERQLPAAQQQGGALTTPGKINFESDAGSGLEGADKDSYAIPFLLFLQPLSPQVAEATVEGAKAGLMLNSVTNDLYESGFIVPCAFQRRWVRWGARDAGGGFKGEFSAAQVAEMRTRGEVKEVDNRLYFPLSDGSINEKKSDRLSDTRNHYVLLLRMPEDETPKPMVMALASTGIKHSKNLMSRIEGIKFKRQNGSLFTPPSFSHMYPVKTAKNTNEKGTWWTPDIGTPQLITNEALYELAKAFHDSVTSGRVEVAHDSVRGEGDTGGGDRSGF